MIEQPTFAPATDRLRRAYGFDEVALVPGAVTLDPAYAPAWLTLDPTFDPLRRNPRFQRLVEGARHA